MRFFVFDQTYATAGKRTGSQAHRAAERVNEEGEKQSAQRDVYINSMQVAVAQGWAPLSKEARASIELHGPYTQDYSRITPLLEPANVESFMNDMLEGAAGALDRALDAGADASSSSAQVRLLATALLGRTQVDVDGPTYMTDNVPLMKTDTAKLSDLVKIIDHMVKCNGGVTPLVLRILGDGQSCLTASYIKRHWPELYKFVLITNGHFHSAGHFQLQVRAHTTHMLSSRHNPELSPLQALKLFWDCFYGRLADVLQKDKVGPDLTHLVNNNFEHTQQFIMPIAAATLIYFVTRD